MPKASQNRMKRADLSEASMSRQPALTAGWFSDDADAVAVQPDETR